MTKLADLHPGWNHKRRRALQTLRAPQHPDRLVAFLWIAQTRPADFAGAFQTLVDRATEVNLAEIPELPAPSIDPPPADIDERIGVYSWARTLSGVTPRALNALSGLGDEHAADVERLARERVELVARVEAEAPR